ncbi:MAG: hypothetical protein ACXWVQ_00825 [Methyloceanibacter sp.]
MVVTGFRAAATLAFLTFPLSCALAVESAALVDQVAPEISEVASGGHWSADGKGGFYRTFVIMGGEKGGIAEIFLQWVSFGDGKPVVVNSLPLKEINEKKLGNASITIGGEDDKENETTIFISSYDIDEDEDIALFVKATKPGSYSIEKAPPEGAQEGETGPEEDSTGKDEAPGIED